VQHFACLSYQGTDFGFVNVNVCIYDTVLLRELYALIQRNIFPSFSRDQWTKNWSVLVHWTFENEGMQFFNMSTTTHTLMRCHSSQVWNLRKAPFVLDINQLHVLSDVCKPTLHSPDSLQWRLPVWNTEMCKVTVETEQWD